jgi:DNA-binding NarL/FixJ family response regulator
MTPVAAPPMTKPRTHPPKAAPARRPRCVVVEDHQMFADLLAISFAAAPDVAIDIVEIATSVAAGIAACDRHKPDVVLLDLKLPDGPGNAIAEHVAATLPETPVIVVSGQSSTFVCPPELASCIYGVVNKADAFHVLQVMLAGLFQPTANGNGGSLSPGRRLTTILTRREREVLALVGQRLSSREIAERIGVSVHTINAHRKNIARKLGIRGTHLALVAYEYRSQLARRP